MSSNLAKLDPPYNSQILLFVDDILKACKRHTLALLKFCATLGQKISKNRTAARADHSEVFLVQSVRGRMAIQMTAYLK